MYEGGGAAARRGPAPPPLPPPADRPGSRRCRRCLITFPDAAFAARHARRQHPRDFAASAALRGAGRGRGRGRGGGRRLACTECGRGFAGEGALHRHYIRHARGEV
ncbi:PREDICTED: zinc finger protein 576-like [Pseudopodoces humilis]|uniref:zinc finger protein 576-like n=1 Tax=Pseudopodoces humilis TaxID=181119 RepID=UPI0006B831E4|nr:PREDICTED: zinc finger protein 576-like [Pseudopodoces humilis]